MKQILVACALVGLLAPRAFAQTASPDCSVATYGNGSINDGAGGTYVIVGSLMNEAWRNGVYDHALGAELEWTGGHLYIDKFYMRNADGTWTPSPMPACGTTPPPPVPTPAGLPVTAASTISWGASPDITATGYHIWLDGAVNKTVSATTTSTPVPAMTDGAHKLAVSSFNAANGLDSPQIPSPPLDVVFSTASTPPPQPTAPLPPSNVVIH